MKRDMEPGEIGLQQRRPSSHIILIAMNINHEKLVT